MVPLFIQDFRCCVRKLLSNNYNTVNSKSLECEGRWQNKEKLQRHGTEVVGIKN